MTLPAFDPAALQFDEFELEGVKKLYGAILKAQAAFGDGFQVEDLIKVPEIALDANTAIQWVVKGRPGDPGDDDAVAERIAALGFGLVRASQLLKKNGPAPAVAAPAEGGGEGD